MDATRSGSGFVGDMRGPANVDLLPMRQRVAWIAGIWLASVATLGLVSWLLADTLS